jgi:hypothetical protein
MEQKDPRPLLAVAPEVIDLGLVSSGARREFTFEVANPGAEPVEVAQIKADCDCIKVKLDTPRIGPSEKTAGRITLDLSGDPEFAGNLSVPVQGHTPLGHLAFNFRVDVSVSTRARLGDS